MRAFAREGTAAVTNGDRAEAICEEKVAGAVVSYSLLVEEVLIAGVDLVETADVLVESADATVVEAGAAEIAGTVAVGMGVVEGLLLVVRPGGCI